MNDSPLPPLLWHRKDSTPVRHATGFAAALAAIDVATLVHEFEHDRLVAPKRHLVGKTYLIPGHNGIPSTKKPSKRLEEHLVLAMFNASQTAPLVRPGDGRSLTTFEYQVPLKARRNDPTGKIDALALLDDQRLCLVEVKCPSPGPKESPARALIELVSYFAVVQANREQFLGELAAHHLLPDVGRPMLGLILGPRWWWDSWETCKKAGDWKADFARLCAELGSAVGLSIACAALDGLSPEPVVFGFEGTAPRFVVTPTLGDVDGLPALDRRIQ
jgi:hypothetical protein